MFVIILKDTGNIHSYFRETINASEFDRIHKNGVRSGFSTFIFHNRDEAEFRLNKMKEQYSNCPWMNIEIVLLNDLKTFVDNHFAP
jgi:hypothetical protein